MHRSAADRLRRRIRGVDDGGATMVEYAFLIALIAVVVVVAVTVFGIGVRALYEPVLPYLS